MKSQVKPGLSKIKVYRNKPSEDQVKLSKYKFGTCQEQVVLKKVVHSIQASNK